MFKNKKIGSNQGVEESEKRKLRILRSYQSLQASPTSVDEIDQENVCEDHRKDIRTSMLEAEHQRARALMAFNNNRRLY